tara:strand:- start:78 stop:278 length:201 start_codon:yes stop_codon:yes gene_type:complete
MKKILLLSVIVILFSCRKTKEDHIRGVIKTHNEVNNTNPKFPVMSKPASSNSTVFRGDSVRIVPKQ